MAAEKREIPKSLDLYEPYIRTRFTDMAAVMFTFQEHPFCKDFDLKHRYCMETYGSPVGDKKCKDLKDDLWECLTRFKQVEIQNLSVNNQKLF